MVTKNKVSSIKQGGYFIIPAGAFERAQAVACNSAPGIAGRRIWMKMAAGVWLIW